MKQYVGIIRDHSGSMGHNSRHRNALTDYNQQLSNLKEMGVKYQIETTLSVIKSSINSNSGTVNQWETQACNVDAISPITLYEATGSSTRIFDAVMDMIQHFEALVPNPDKDTAFLLQIVTDGEDNASIVPGRTLATKLNELAGRSNWTVTFRVPHGQASTLTSLGISKDNIFELNFDSIAESRAATAATTQATEQYFLGRTRGLTASANFYAGTSNLNVADVQNNLVELSVRPFNVTSSTNIQDFVTAAIGSYRKGCAFYQLTKPEDIQPTKEIIVKDKNTGKFYGGANARSLLGLAANTTIRVSPGSTPRFDIFVQSTSSNRRLVPNTVLVVH